MLNHKEFAKLRGFVRTLQRHRYSDLILICIVILSFSMLIIASCA